MSRKIEKENRKSNVILKIIGILNIIIAALFDIYIYSLNILPNKYLILFVISTVILQLLITFGIIKNRKNKIINIICIVFACLIFGVYFIVYDYSKKGFDFVNSMSNINYQIEEYYVLSLAENNYNNLKDLRLRKIFKSSNTPDNFDVITELSNNGGFKVYNYANIHSLKEDLIDKKIESILLSSSEYLLLCEEDNDFQNIVSKVYIAKHKIGLDNETDIYNETNIGDSNLTIKNGKFNVYISGVDVKGNINKVARTDANIVVTVNLNSREALLTSIPRDYYVRLHSKRSKDKLTHSGIYGIKETVTTVEDLLKTDINYFVRVNFTTVIKVIDAIGGIEVDSDFDFNMVDEIEGKVYKFKKGINKLNGHEALAFCRERSSFTMGDNQRVRNQQKVVEAFINKISKTPSILTKYTSILDSLSNSFQINLTKDEISYLVKDQLNDMREWKVTKNTLEGTSGHASTYSLGNKQVYVTFPRIDSVNEAIKKINIILDK